MWRFHSHYIIRLVASVFFWFLFPECGVTRLLVSRSLLISEGAGVRRQGSMASKGANKGINDPRLKAYHLLPPDKGVQVCMLRVGRVACRRGWIGGWGLSLPFVCL